MTRVAVICSSATGNVHALAEAVAEGATDAGGRVRLRRVAELAPPEAVTRAGGNPYGTSHASAGGPPGGDVLAAARSQGCRLAPIAELVAGRRRAERVAASAISPLCPAGRAIAAARTTGARPCR